LGVNGIAEPSRDNLAKTRVANRGPAVDEAAVA
jgi:hypothetical protein